MASKKELTIDEKMDLLDEIIDKMEGNEVTLEESFNLYKQGVGLIKECNDSIDRVEKEVLKLNEDGSLEALDGEDDGF